MAEGSQTTIAGDRWWGGLQPPHGLLLLPLAVFLCAFLLWPLAVLVYESTQQAEGSLTAATGASPGPLTNYLEIFRTSSYRREAVHSVLLSAAVAASSVVLCLGPAWLFARKTFPGKRLLRAVYTLPLSLSGVIVGFLTVIMLGRIGFVPQVLEAVTGRPLLSGAAYQFSGLAMAYIYFEIPRATLSLESSFKKFDVQLEAAARSLGADRWQRFRLVMWPLFSPALLSAFAVTFTVSLGSFGVVLILSRRFSVLPVQIYEQLTAFLNTGLAAAMSVFLLVVALAVNYGLQAWADRRYGAFYGSS